MTALKSNGDMFLDLKCNNMRNPLGVLRGEVAFSFYRGENYFDEYVIGLASSEEKLREGEYDIGEEHCRGLLKCYLNLSGKAGERVYWHVRTETAVSETAYFEWAEDFHGAKWIASAQETDRVLLFKKSVTVKGKLKKARLQICGLGFYDSAVNGKKLDDRYYKPNFTDYKKRKTTKADKTYYAFYDTYDVTAFLKEGKNVLETLVAGGYFNTDRKEVYPWHFGTNRLKFMLSLVYENKTEYVVSDESCLCAVTPNISKLYRGDCIDFRESVLVFAPSVAVEDEVPLLPAKGESDRVCERLAGKLISKSENKSVYDFSKNHTGGVDCIVVGKAGAKLTVRFAEILDEKGELNFETANVNSLEADGNFYPVVQKNEYILSGGEDHVQPTFCWRCYRYVEFLCDEPIEIKNLQSLFIHTDIEKTGDFVCSEESLNDLYEKYVNTQLCNMHCGVPTDCPHREKMPYTGDGHITAKSVLYNFDAEAFYEKWLDDILYAQEEDGRVPNTAPNMECGGGHFWGYAIAVMPKLLYNFRLDRKSVKKCYPAIINWVNYLNTLHNGDYILSINKHGGWLLSDWLAPEIMKVNVRYFSTICFYLSIKGALWAHRQVSDKKNEELIELAEKVRRAINDKFFNKEKMCYASGKQGETVMALWAGVVESSWIPALNKAVREHYSKTTNYHLDTGIVMTPILIDYLTENGMADIAYKIMTQNDFPSYADMLDGETTLSEHWSRKWVDYQPDEDKDDIVKGGGDLSHCHPMYGSVVAWLFEKVAGIDLSSSWCAEINIEPKFLKYIPYAKAKSRTVTGEAAVEYDIRSGFAMKVKIPFGFTGKVKMADMHGDFVVAGDERGFVATADGLLQLDLSYGEWTINRIS